MTPLTIHQPLTAVVPYINWSYFFHAWGFPARFGAVALLPDSDSRRATWVSSFAPQDRERASEAATLFVEAQRHLQHYAPQYQSHFRFLLADCHAEEDDVVLDDVDADKVADASGTVSARLCFLRQQQSPYLCLSDFISPEHDRIGLFVASVDAAFEQVGCDTDEYRHLMAQTLADRLAESTVEQAHEHIRKQVWAYAPDERLSITDLFAERFAGIRPAVGYPSLPDQSLNFDLDRWLDFASIGVSLTESGAMRPHASVSGLMLAHPQAHYFSIGPIGEDQLSDYARRRGRCVAQLRPYLAANL